MNEWVSTCNYWAARQSKEPLAGGVSNMEYGWNRVLDPPEQVRSMSDNESSRAVDRSDAMSVRSSRSRYGRKDGVLSTRSSQSPWADRIMINDWKAPLPPTVASTHDEETQLEALQKHVKYMSDDLKRHNGLRTPMMELVRFRSDAGFLISNDYTPSTLQDLRTPRSPSSTGRTRASTCSQRSSNTNPTSILCNMRWPFG